MRRRKQFANTFYLEAGQALGAIDFLRGAASARVFAIWDKLYIEVRIPLLVRLQDYLEEHAG